MKLSARIERWPLAATFTISRGSRTEAVVVVVELDDGVHRGRGEAVPYARYGEVPERVLDTIEALHPAVEHGLDRVGLATALPGRRRAQAARLRVLGPRRQAIGPPRLRIGGSRGAGARQHRLYGLARFADRNGCCGRTFRLAPAAQGQAWRRR